jgi:hypothetical protein
MKILYIGHSAPASTSRHRADALMRLGHEVIVADPYAALATHLRGHLRGALHYRTGYRVLQHAACARVAGLMRQRVTWPEFYWGNGGKLSSSVPTNKLRRFHVPADHCKSADLTDGQTGKRFMTMRSGCDLARCARNTVE